MKTAIRKNTTKRARGWLLVALAVALAASASAQASKSSTRDRIKRVALVSLPDRKLAVVENGKVIGYFPVAIGAAESPSPTGEFEIVSRVANPTYYHEGAVVPPGKNNPVGTRWLGISLRGYGIHGTNVPKSIGHASSHGCIRLRNRDMEKLFAMLRVGDLVQIRDERDEQVAQIFGGRVDNVTVAVAQVSVQAAGQ